MRKISLAFLFSAYFVAAAYGQAATFSETNVSRPGGAYSNAAAPTASACASLCAGDRLCMAWDYAVATQICELKAVAPAPRQATGFVSGLSARAPAFARAMSVPTPPTSPALAPIAAAIAAQPTTPTTHTLPPSGPETSDEGLLGGPEITPDAPPGRDLRTRSAN